MKIGIIGAGNIGATLARHFTKLHHPVIIANSRGPETLEQLAQETGATAVPAVDAATGVDLLVITIPTKSVPPLPADLHLGFGVAELAWRSFVVTRSTGITPWLSAGAASGPATVMQLALG